MTRLRAIVNEPGIKPSLAVVLAATHQNPHPDLLKKVLGQGAVAGQIEQIAQQPDAESAESTGPEVADPAA